MYYSLTLYLSYFTHLCRNLTQDTKQRRKTKKKYKGLLAMASRRRSKVSQRRAIDRKYQKLLTLNMQRTGGECTHNGEWKASPKGEQVPESTSFYTPSTRNGEWKVSNSQWRMHLLARRVRAAKIP